MRVRTALMMTASSLRGKGVLNPLPESRLLVPTPSLPGHLGRRGCTGRGNDQAGGLGRTGEPLIVGNKYRQVVVE